MNKKVALMGIFFLTLFFLSGCDFFDAAVQIAVERTQTELEKAPLGATNTRASKPNLTSTKKPAVSKVRTPTQEPYISASNVTINQKGQTLEIYGRVTYAGEEPCPECPNGYYAYLILDKSFYIISYDWVFYSSMVGDCIMVKDEVEAMGTNPVFVFGSKEGYDGSKCEILSDGTLSCREGDYFKLYSGCR